MRPPTSVGGSNASAQVRIAALEDARLIASVLLESFIEHKDLYTPEAFAATILDSEKVLSRMEEGPMWIALLDGAVVGTVAAVARRDEELYIRGMAVLPTLRGRGIGQLLLRQIEDYALLRGYERLILSTTPFLHQAIRLYERFGFQRDKEGPHDLFGTPLFTMVKNLGGAH